MESFIQVMDTGSVREESSKTICKIVGTERQYVRRRPAIFAVCQEL